MQTPFFYTSANTARVMVAMDVPTEGIKFQKVKGKQHAEMNVLGIAYRPDGNVAGRFSDVVKWDFEEKKEAETFGKRPYRYENQFDLASGEYTLKVAFSSGEAGFGKLESPLKIDPFDGKQFTMSALAISKDVRKVDQTGPELDAELQEGRTPLVTGGLQFKPAGSEALQGDRDGGGVLRGVRAAAGGDGCRRRRRHRPKWERSCAFWTGRRARRSWIPAEWRSRISSSREIR